MINLNHKIILLCLIILLQLLIIGPSCSFLITVIIGFIMALPIFHSSHNDLNKKIIVRFSQDHAIQVGVPTFLYIKQNRLDSMRNRSNTHFYNGAFILFFNTLQHLTYAHPEISNRVSNNLALAAVIAWRSSSNEYRLEFKRLARKIGIED